MSERPASTHNQPTQVEEEPAATAAPPDPRPLTTEQPGRYALRREFGRGGQAVVWLAYDEHIGREVAFKQLLPDQAQSDRASARFLREARVTGQLEHPSIVPVYELGVRGDGTRYYTQKLVRGRTLYEALTACAGLQERLRLLPHFVDVCQALAYAHGRGVVHRDIKPENVMVGEFGETVVLDWGLAKVRDARETETAGAPPPTSLPSHTALGTVLGTPLYMSPEQALGRLDEVDARSDVWSLGAMLFELLTGQPPYTGDSSEVVIRRVTTEEPPAIGALCPEAPPELASVAGRALQKRREDRYATARELAAEVQAWMSGARVRAYDYSSWELVKKFVARNRLLSAVSAAAVVLLALASILIARAQLASQAHLAEARGNLSQALLEKARAAAGELRWQRAAALFAAARVQRDSLPARFGLAQAEARAELPAALVDARSGAVWAAVALPGERLATGGDDGSVRVFDGAGAQLFVRHAHAGSVSALARSPAGQLLASTGVDGAVLLWDAQTGAPRRTLLAGGEELWCVAFSRDGQLVAAGGVDQTVRIWRVASGQLIAELRGHDERITGLAFGPGDRLASASFDGTVRLWLHLGQGWREAERLTAPGAQFWAVAISPDGHTLAAAGNDGLLRRWRPGAANAVVRLEGHDRTVAAVAFSPDGALLASAGWDGSARIWDVEAARGLLRIDAHERPASSIAFSPDGRALFTAAEDGLVRASFLPRQPQSFSLAGHRGEVRAVAFSPGGQLASAGADGTVRLWDPVSRRLLRTLEVSGWARAVDFSADGKLVAAGGDEPPVHVWEAATGRAVALLQGHTAEVWSVRFSPRGRLLASAANDGTVRLWDPATGAQVRSIDSGQGKVRALSFSPGGSWLASAGADQTARLWQVDTGRERLRLGGHDAHLRAVAFSPDGQLVATGANDRAVLIFEAASGQLLRRLEGHEGQVRGVAFLPDGRTLLSAGGDRTARLWDVASGAELVTLVRHDDEVLALAVSPDGAWAATASRDGELQLTRTFAPDPRPPEEALRELLAAHRLKLSGLQLSLDRALPPPQPNRPGGRSSTAKSKPD